MKIIIGASGGIGKKLYDHYWGKQEVVYGTFCNSKTEEEEFMWKVDITKPESVKYFAEGVDLYDSKAILINCAGVSVDSMAHKSTPISWGHVIDVNLIGAFNVIRAFLPYMRKHNYGRIINMGSVVAQMGVAGTSAYAASKAGLWGMTKAIALENAANGITINTLNLGYMDAGMGLACDGEYKGAIENIINAIDFLVESPFVTGTSIDINGGLL